MFSSREIWSPVVGTMVDRLTPQQRSNLMRQVRGKDTAPEMIVRRLVHAAGFRYRLHRKDLPGKPDLCFSARRKIIFVHGCFWHGHGCKIGRLPKSRPEFWKPKIARNRERDRDAVAALETLGWRVLTVWQCETKDTESLRQRVVEFLADG
jgi:DNA mismatch endonuclease (patch repair protein)